MPDRYLATAYFIKCLVLASVSTAMSLAGAATAVATSTNLWTQLNKTHVYMGLAIPLWIIGVAIVLLSFVGAFWSLQTDTLQGKGSLTVKILTAITVGLVASFVIAPAVTDTPNIFIMMIVSLLGSFAGTVLLYLFAQLINNKELQAAVIEIISGSVKGFLRRLLGGGR